MASLSAPACWVLGLTLLAMCCTSEASRRHLQATTLEEADNDLELAKATVVKAESGVARAKRDAERLASMCDNRRGPSTLSCRSQQTKLQAMAKNAIPDAEKLLDAAQQSLEEAQKIFDGLNNSKNRQKMLVDAKAKVPSAATKLAEATAAREVAEEISAQQVEECKKSMVGKHPASSISIIKCINEAMYAVFRAKSLESDAGKALERAQEEVKKWGG